VASTRHLARVRAFAATPAGSVALLVLAGTIAVAAVPFWILRRADETPASEAFVSSPEFVVWVLIVCGQAAVWVGAAAYVITSVVRRVRDLRGRDALPRAAVAAIATAAVGLALVTVLLLFGDRLGLYPDFEGPRGLPKDGEWPLYGHQAKVTPFVATAMLIGVLAIAGMWLTAVGFAQLARGAPARKERVERFVALRAELSTLLAITALLIGLATLASGALREAVLAENRLPAYRDAAIECIADESGESVTSVRARFGEFGDSYPECLEWQFDRRYVLAYGLLFSAVLALAFAPAFVVMRRAGHVLRNDAYALPDPSDAEFFDVVEKREAFDVLLQTNLSSTVVFKAGAAILTPLAASLVSTLVPT
jgi:hypothetical protein